MLKRIIWCVFLLACHSQANPVTEPQINLPDQELLPSSQLPEIPPENHKKEYPDEQNFYFNGYSSNNVKESDSAIIFPDDNESTTVSFTNVDVTDKDNAESNFTVQLHNLVAMKDLKKSLFNITIDLNTTYLSLNHSEMNKVDDQNYVFYTMKLSISKGKEIFKEDILTNFIKLSSDERKESEKKCETHSVVEKPIEEKQETFTTNPSILLDDEDMQIGGSGYGSGDGSGYGSEY